MESNGISVQINGSERSQRETQRKTPRSFSMLPMLASLFWLCCLHSTVHWHVRSLHREASYKVWPLSKRYYVVFPSTLKILFGRTQPYLNININVIFTLFGKYRIIKGIKENFLLGSLVPNDVQKPRNYLPFGGTWRKCAAKEHMSSSIS